MNGALTQREFDTWRESDAELKRQIISHMEKQTEINLNVEGRLTVVEVEQKDCRAKVSRRSTFISGIVAAIVGSITTYFAGR